ncbi:MAG TPA: hypothetical protein VFS66_05125 [Acidimicrobiia bacterium]|nr:hypothetical protein [Acidimicrobiia bacterium]
MGLATLKESSTHTDRTVMTASAPVMRAWATRPLGKAARVAIAAGGMVLGTLILTFAAIAPTGSWLLVVFGVGVAALSVRAARIPSAGRLVTLTAITMTALASIQVF